MSCDAENREQFRLEAYDTKHFLFATVVGSCPKSKWLNHANDLTEDSDSKFTQEHLHEAHDSAYRVVTNKHERSGPDAVVDSEMRHKEMVEYFAHRIPGYESNGPVKVWDHNYFDKPFVVGEVEHDESQLVDEFEFTSDVASKLVKMPITGPYALTGWSFNGYCDFEAGLAYALVNLANEEIEQLVETDTAYIQIDEPALATTSDDHAIIGECLERIIMGVPDEVRIGLHVCYDDYSRTYPEFSDHPADEFDVKLCNSGYEQIDMSIDPEFEPDLTFGIVDVHTTEVETVKEIKENIKQGLEVVSSEELTVSPDCGVELPPREIAYQKMESMVKAIRGVEAELDADEVDLNAPIPQAD